MLAGRPREEKAVKDDEGRKHCQNDDSNPKLSCGHGARQLRAPIQKANEARQKHIRGKSDRSVAEQNTATCADQNCGNCKLDGARCLHGAMMPNAQVQRPPPDHGARSAIAAAYGA